MKVLKNAVSRFWLFYAVPFLAMSGMAVRPAYATGAAAGSMPWDYTLNSVIMEMTGPIAQGIAIITIVLLFWGMTQSQGHEGAQKFFKVGLGIAGSLEAGTVATRFFMGGASL
ncbi:MAG: TrbC/VirB2 family protein [Nitrospiraceae bacterium]|nr:TrbC/VirB2 family protein [Nitrospiraceae bacterium]